MSLVDFYSLREIFPSSYALSDKENLPHTTMLSQCLYFLTDDCIRNTFFLFATFILNNRSLKDAIKVVDSSLLEKAAQLQLKKYKNLTLLHLAVICGSQESVKLLIPFSNIHQEDLEGFTAAHHTVVQSEEFAEFFFSLASDSLDYASETLPLLTPRSLKQRLAFAEREESPMELKIRENGTFRPCSKEEFETITQIKYSGQIAITRSEVAQLWVDSNTNLLTLLPECDSISALIPQICPLYLEQDSEGRYNVRAECAILENGPITPLSGSFFYLRDLAPQPKEGNAATYVVSQYEKSQAKYPKSLPFPNVIHISMETLKNMKLHTSSEESQWISELPLTEEGVLIAIRPIEAGDALLIDHAYCPYGHQVEGLQSVCERLFHSPDNLPLPPSLTEEQRNFCQILQNNFGATLAFSLFTTKVHYLLLAYLKGYVTETTKIKEFLSYQFHLLEKIKTESPNHEVSLQLIANGLAQEIFDKIEEKKEWHQELERALENREFPILITLISFIACSTPSFSPKDLSQCIQFTDALLQCKNCQLMSECTERQLISRLMLVFKKHLAPYCDIKRQLHYIIDARLF